MKKPVFDKVAKQWKRLKKQHRRTMKQIRRTQKQFKKTFNRKTLTPKPVRQFQNVRKIARSVQKNSGAYLTGVYAAAHTVGNFFKVP